LPTNQMAAGEFSTTDSSTERGIIEGLRRWKSREEGR
jgi:hypothetical protein